MKTQQLAIYIGAAIIGFLLLSLFVGIAAWIIKVLLLVALIVVVIYLMSEYAHGKKKSK